MAAATAIMLGASLALAAGSTAYGISEQNKARKQAEAQGEEQAKEQEQMIAGAQAQQASEKKRSDAAAAQEQARQRQRAAIGESEGRAGTILTSPLGVQAPASGGGKTLLGT